MNKKLELERELEIQKERLVNASKLAIEELIKSFPIQRWVSTYPVTVTAVAVVAGVIIAQKIPLNRDRRILTE